MSLSLHWQFLLSTAGKVNLWRKHDTAAMLVFVFVFFSQTGENKQLINPCVSEEIHGFFPRPMLTGFSSEESLLGSVEETGHSIAREKRD